MIFAVFHALLCYIMCDKTTTQKTAHALHQYKQLQNFSLLHWDVVDDTVGVLASFQSLCCNWCTILNSVVNGFLGSLLCNGKELSSDVS